jgi:DNA-binding NarL/FixJ family response regulator
LLRADFPNAPPGAPAENPAPSPLTPREHEVLRLLADGLSDREIAARFVISPKTVEKHVGAVLRKTGTASRTAAVMYGLDHGWIASDDLQIDDPTDR